MFVFYSQNRLKNLADQSRELNHDLTLRARKHLEDMNNHFILDGSTLDLVEKEAFYLWATSKMVGHPLTYDQLQRICGQLTDHPHEQQWTLQVGGGWNVVRNGAALFVTRDGIMENEEKRPERKLDWSFVQDAAEPTENVLLIRLSENVEFDETKCCIVLADASRTGNLLFHAPWRENPVKLRDFLRGQKVPLHLRGCVPVILLDQRTVVAVFVERPGGEHHFGGKVGRWIVDAQFCVESERASHQICLQLQE